MENLIILFITIVANVLSQLICKWFDSNHKR